MRKVVILLLLIMGIITVLLTCVVNTTYEYVFPRDYSGEKLYSFNHSYFEIGNKTLELYLSVDPKWKDYTRYSYKEYYRLFITFGTHDMPINRIIVKNIIIEYKNNSENLLNDVDRLLFSNGYYMQRQEFEEDKFIQFKKDGILEFPSDHEWNDRSIIINNLPINFNYVKEFKIRLQFQVDYPEGLDINSTNENSIYFEKEYKLKRHTRREIHIPSA
jgi:hypothetical protein